MATAGVVLPGLGDDEPAGPAPTESPTATGADTPVSGFDDSERAGISSVLQTIEAGGSLPYAEDGQTFQNREGLLPSQPIGYYREYTVETPGSPDRGARRLVIGDGGETYYTADHYGSFTRIDPADFET